MVDNELVPAHLHYSDCANTIIGSQGYVHYFIYRDPRDICISEAHYLSDMNRWHKLSKHFASCSALSDKIDLSINGLPESVLAGYPNIGARVERYLGWLESDNVLALKYEDLRSENAMKFFQTIFEHFSSQSGMAIDSESMAEQAFSNLNSSRSHTFRSGAVQQWKTVLTDRQKKVIDDIAGESLQRLGYLLSTHEE